METTVETIAHPKRVLIVDDNRDAADLTAILLEMHGHVVAAAYGGAHGIELAQQFKPDVVLLDIGMPGLNGYDVASALRKIPEVDHALLVAYTAWNDAATRSRAAAVGFDRHLAKPARIESLLAALDGAARTATAGADARS